MHTPVYSLNYSPRDGKTGYIPLIVSDESAMTIVSGIYKFDAEKGTAVQGLSFPTVAADQMTSLNIISSISWLPLKK